MAPKVKPVDTSENPMIPPPVDLDHIPLADRDYKVTEPRCEFDFFELHSWMKEIFLDQSDEIGLWESNFPCICFLRLTTSQNLSSDAKPVTFLAKEPLPPPLVKYCSQLPPKPSTKCYRSLEMT
jgi:hypothetical protein